MADSISGIWTEDSDLLIPAACGGPLGHCLVISEELIYSEL